jgi:hypothetical protein
MGAVFRKSIGKPDTVAIRQWPFITIPRIALYSCRIPTPKPLQSLGNNVKVAIAFDNGYRWSGPGWALSIKISRGIPMRALSAFGFLDLTAFHRRYLPNPGQIQARIGQNPPLS